ncbi:periplasmic heavy metal sensor [Algoriphagus chordae]|uniref:Heavy-metal resistance protein n=1 Tax=Algoriphagus chordae TaxID=237019 RepID=A0A2W7QTY4_9BACT|nr:periplasmic heavy metal sensor [Algoriphagus chordae]PZX50616.1 heavy-metal resistance protein [Algoriphagus chordae]
MKNLLTVKVSFAILVLLNLVLIFLLVVKPAGPPMRGQNNDLVDMISTKLKLDESQKSSYEALAKVHSEEMMKLDHRQMEATNTYFQLLKSDQLDEQEKSVALEKIKQIQGEKIRITFDHFEELKLICHADQLSDFNEVVDELIPAILGGRKNNSPPPRDK